MTTRELGHLFYDIESLIGVSFGSVALFPESYHIRIACCREYLVDYDLHCLITYIHSSEFVAFRHFKFELAVWTCNCSFLRTDNLDHSTNDWGGFVSFNNAIINFSFTYVKNSSCGYEILVFVVFYHFSLCRLSF